MSSVVECHVTGEASYLYPPEREPVDPTIDSACSIEQQRTVQEAWNGAGIFASSHARWQPDRTVTPGSPQDVMDHYLGTLSRLDTPSNGGEGPLRRNVLREQGLFQTNNWSPRTRTLQVLMFCDERRSARFTRQPSGHPLHPPGYAPRQCSVPNTVTYSWGFTIGEVTMKFMIFCPEFFSAVYYPLGMIERIARSPGHAHYRSNLIPWCLTRALYMMQNTYTWSEVTDPPCDHAPPVTGPDECLELATRENAYGLRPGEQGAARNGKSSRLVSTACIVLMLLSSAILGFRRHSDLRLAAISLDYYSNVGLGSYKTCSGGSTK